MAWLEDRPSSTEGNELAATAKVETVVATTAEVEPVADIATETEARPSIAVDPLYLLFSFCDITCTTILWFTA